MLAESKKLVDNAERQGRGLTGDERRTVEGHLERVDQIKKTETILKASEAERPSDDEIRREVERSNIHGHGTGSFSKAVLDQGWNLKHNPVIETSISRVIGKASVLPAVDTWSSRDPVVAPIGQDSRCVFPNLQTENVEGESAVSTFHQTSRTLTGNVQRNLDATTDKAKLDIELEHAVEALKQFALVIEDIPNAVLESVDNMRQPILLLRWHFPNGQCHSHHGG